MQAINFFLRFCPCLIFAVVVMLCVCVLPINTITNICCQVNTMTDQKLQCGNKAQNYKKFASLSRFEIFLFLRDFVFFLFNSHCDRKIIYKKKLEMKREKIFFIGCDLININRCFDMLNIVYLVVMLHNYCVN